MPAASAYVDTSVLGAYYCPEPLSAAAETALRGLATPVISTLTEVDHWGRSLGIGLPAVDMAFSPASQVGAGAGGARSY